jgi:raffinose/stachyose/melibiose transport system substrate-binding protein
MTQTASTNQSEGSCLMDARDRVALGTQLEHLQRLGLSRRELLRALGIVGGTGAFALLADGVGAQQTPAAGRKPAIKGSTLEVGVIYPEGSPTYAADERIIKAMEADYPGTKITATFANTAARPALNLRWQSGDPLDVDNIFNALDRTALHWVTDGALYDLTDAVTATPWGEGMSWDEAIFPNFRKSCVVNNKYYAVPTQATVFGLFYNRKVFDDNGVKPPATWDELVQVGEAVKKKGIDPIAVTGTFTPYMGQWWDLLLQREIGAQAVMDVAWGDKKAADNPGFLAAAQKIQDIVDRDFFLKGFQGIDFTAAQVQFFRGKTAMILMGSWLASEMKASIPPDFQLGIVKFPTVADGKGDQNGLFGFNLTWSVAAKSKNPPLAIEYLRRQTSQDEQTRRVKDLDYISSYQHVPTPTDTPGLPELLAKTDQAEFTYYYYGIVSDKERWDAWYTPVSKLFFKQIKADEMIKEIDQNLARLRASKKP